MKPSLFYCRHRYFFLLFGVIGFSFSPHPCCHWCTIGQISPHLPFPFYLVTLACLYQIQFSLRSMTGVCMCVNEK